MSEDRIHRTTSADGTTITGRVHGHGPPLVLVPGGPADGDTGWLSLLPHLTDRVTCLTIDTRGRGSSGDHPDHSRDRLVEDIVAFVESIDGEVALFGHSAGGALALGAAACARNLRALALYEPALLDLADGGMAARFADGIDRVQRAVADGRPADGVRVFVEELALANDEELATVDEVGAVHDMVPLLDVVLDEVRQSGLPHLGDPTVLDRIDLPVLLLHGSRTHPLYGEVVAFLEQRLAAVRTLQLPALGHLGPELDPESVADALVGFLDRVPVSANTVT